MPAAPPKVTEAIVGFLIPPACREHVLGDLHERYVSPGQYTLEAARTVPLVILSRIRRTTDPQVLLMEALVLYISFIAAAWYLDPAFLSGPWGLLRLAVPAAIVLVALIFADAYADPTRRSPLKPVLGAALGVGFAFLSQAILSAGNRKFTVPRWIMIYGGAMSLLLVSALRIIFTGDWPRHVS